MKVYVLEYQSSSIDRYATRRVGVFQTLQAAKAAAMDIWIENESTDGPFIVRIWTKDATPGYLITEVVVQ